MDKDDKEQFDKQFKLVCLKCNSDNVVFDLTKGIDYGGQTGYQSGTLSVGCNNCNQNDFWAML